MRHKIFRWLQLLILVTAAAALSLGAALSTSPIGYADDAGWDPSLPKVLSAGAPGDPVAIANASLQASALATQTTLDMGHKFLASLGLVSDNSAAPGGRVYGRKK